MYIFFIFGILHFPIYVETFENNIEIFIFVKYIYMYNNI